MKALMLEQYEDLQVIDMPEPACGADEVLIRVAACGICGSDVHGYDGGSGRRIPPIVMGHEAAGVVTQVGADVLEYKPGDPALRSTRRCTAVRANTASAAK